MLESYSGMFTAIKFQKCHYFFVSFLLLSVVVSPLCPFLCQADMERETPTSHSCCSQEEADASTPQRSDKNCCLQHLKSWNVESKQLDVATLGSVSMSIPIVLVPSVSGNVHIGQIIRDRDHAMGSPPIFLFHQVFRI